MRLNLSMQENERGSYSCDAQPTSGVGHLGADLVAQGSRSGPEVGNPTEEQPLWSKNNNVLKIPFSIP